MMILDREIFKVLGQQARSVERIFDADCLLYYGILNPTCMDLFEHVFDELKSASREKKRLVIFLDTSGGSAEFVERLVDMIRAHYDEVYFVVVREAMSAGTIFACSGDRIYMSFKSCLGPIDPQILSKGDRAAWIPAQGYLEKFNELVQKSMSGKLSPVETSMALQLDLADLNLYEQAKSLTVTLLKKWLVQYKFKSWEYHRNGDGVTPVQREARAKEIATMLGDNKKWHSHSRCIGMKTLQDELRLHIDDYYFLGGKSAKIIEEYATLAAEYAQSKKFMTFVHTKHASC